MKTIIEGIKKEIKNHQNVKNSVLEDVVSWKRTHYILLAEIVSQELSHSKFLQGERKFELGNTISYITLQRFFDNSYKTSALNDLRFIKTLDKLCIFLGHYDLNEYILNSKLLTISDDQSEQIEPYRKIIETFCQNEFKAIQKLPEIDLSDIYPYVFEDSAIIRRIKEYMKRYKDAEYHFDFEYEFAKFELLDCELLSDEEDLKVLKAHEFWDLVLKTAEGKVFFYKVMNFQTYFLKKDQDMQWKIWDNYNPNLQRVITTYV